MSSDGSIYHFHIKPSLHHARPWSSSRNVFTVDEAIFPIVKDVSLCSCNTASQGGGYCQDDEDSQDSLKDFHFSQIRSVIRDTETAGHWDSTWRLEHL